MAIPLIFAALLNATRGSGIPLVFVLALVPALTIAVELANWMVTQIVKPESLPQMDFSQGIPEECGSLVVIPAMLSESDEVISLLGQLEQHYLRNPDPGLRFALVTDFMDGPAENQPSDFDLVERARQGIRALNKKYPRAALDRFAGRFALLQRERRWNPSEGVWMGWERNRGELHELNQLILAAQNVSLGDQPSGKRIIFPNPGG